MKVPWRPILIGSCIVLPLAAGCLWYARAIHDRLNRLNAMEGEIAAIRSRLPDKRLVPKNKALQSAILDFHTQNFADVLQTVTNDCTKLNVRNCSITTGAAVQGGGFNEVPISVTFSGPLASAFLFADRLHKNDAIIRLEQLTITREPLAAPDGLTVSMQFETFTGSDREAP